MARGQWRRGHLCRRGQYVKEVKQDARQFLANESGRRGVELVVACHLPSSVLKAQED